MSKLISTLVLALGSSSTFATGWPSDDCAAPTPIVQGLNGGYVSSDYVGGTYYNYNNYWRVDVPPNHRWTVTCDQIAQSSGASGWGHVRGPGGSGCSAGGAYIDENSPPIVRVNTSPTTETYFVGMTVWGGCDTCDIWADYTLLSVIEPIACSGSDDAFEPSSFALPRRLTSRAMPYVGLYAASSYSENADDVYVVAVPPGATLGARIDFVHADSDLDLRVAPQDLSLPWILSASTLDFESVSIVNTTSSVADYLVHVRPNSSGFGACNDYSLALQVENSALGTNYCIGAPNSTGLGATLRAFGSSSVSANTLSFLADGLPPSVPCLLYYGPNPSSVPFGDGVRCIGSPSFRKLTLFSSSLGRVTFPFDLATSPAGGAITAGSTFHFQGYYRNLTGPLGTGFNLTDGYTIPFHP